MLNSRLESFSYAFKGVKDLYSSQPNVKIHLIATILAIAFACWLKISAIEWGLLLVTITMVFAAEALNTAPEYLTDLTSPEFHPLAGKAKDAGAASVLITAIGAIGVGAAIFGPKLIRWFFF